MPPGRLGFQVWERVCPQAVVAVVRLESPATRASRSVFGCIIFILRRFQLATANIRNLFRKSVHSIWKEYIVRCCSLKLRLRHLTGTPMAFRRNVTGSSAKRHRLFGEMSAALRRKVSGLSALLTARDNKVCDATITAEAAHQIDILIIFNSKTLVLYQVSTYLCNRSQKYT